MKTASEAHRIPVIAENIAALEAAARRAKWARLHSTLPTMEQVDHSEVLAEASALIEAVLDLSDDVGYALKTAFAAGLLDVPFCLHQDNRGLAQGAIDAAGRLVWANVGKLPLPAFSRSGGRRIVSAELWNAAVRCRPAGPAGNRGSWRRALGGDGVPGGANR